MLFERALYNWLFKKTKTFTLGLNADNNKTKNNNDIRLITNTNYNIHQQHRLNNDKIIKYNQPPTIKPKIQFYNNQNNNNKQNNNNNNDKLDYAQKPYQRKQQQQHQQQQQQKPQWQQEQQHNNQINNRYSFKPKSNHASRNVLISNYPHFLRHKKEFFRKIIIPTELEKEKENIFLLSNLHYETEYFKSESEKW
ncbi:unnamed protein product, partial [Rotaria magnacalcarata]